MLRVFRDAIAAIDKRTATDPAAAAKTLSPEIALPEAVVKVAVERQSWDVRSMDVKLVADQQAIADTFYKLGLIPKAIKISDALA